MVKVVKKKLKEAGFNEIFFEKPLTEILFDNCKAIEEIEILGELENLYWLKMIDLGEIKSLSFIKKIKSLRKISFVDTNILDGDLSYCKGLEYVGFLDKKHYSHKNSEF
jgi:hypothetical protein